MKALVVYDSIFGNTEQIAQAVGEALAAHGEVELLRVGDIQPERLAGADLVVMGSPTRAFSPTPAIKSLLKSIPKRSLEGVMVAAFDTRIALEDVDSRILPPLVKIFGYAADPISNRLEHRGGVQAVPPEGFFVEGTEGPLKEGELDRAAAWAEQIAAQL